MLISRIPRQPSVGECVPGAHAPGQFQAVGHDDERDPLGAIQLDEEVAEGAGRCVIQRAGGLVGQQQPGAVDQRAHDGGALRLAAGKQARTMVAPVGEPDALQQRLRPPGIRLPLRARPAGGEGRQQHILQHGALRQQMMLLEHESDQAVAQAGQRILGQQPQVPAVQHHRPRGRPVEAADDVEQRAFAASGRPDHRERFPGLHAQADAVQHAERGG
jgi:hypothetical protein